MATRRQRTRTWRLANHFREHGSLYGSDDSRAIAAIRRDCRRAGVPMGRPGLAEPPEVLDPDDLPPPFTRSQGRER